MTGPEKESKQFKWWNDDNDGTYFSARLLPRLQFRRRQQDRAWKQPSPGEKMIVNNQDVWPWLLIVNMDQDTDIC